MSDSTLGNKVSHNNAEGELADETWKLAHCGEDPLTCGYCGCSKNSHIFSDRRFKTRVHPKWHVPRVKYMYTAFYSKVRALDLGVKQAVCFQVPMIAESEGGLHVAQ